MLGVVRAFARHALPVLLLSMATSTAYGQTTAFTYQGQLSEGSAVANGNYDLRFALFATGEGGAQIGTPQTVPAVAVSGGLFTVQLDFGASAFPGANRFLEIGVKPAGGGTFTTLAPRQQISSSPYSIRTLSAATADALSSACVGCVQTAQINSVAGSKISGTIPAASVPTGSGNYIQNTNTPQASANFNIGGNGVVGGNLTVSGTLNANVGGNFIQNRTTQQPTANFNVSGNGTVGGTLTASKVEIAAQDALRITGFQPFITLRDANDGNKRALLSTGFGDLGFYVESSIGGNPTVLIKNASGNVGIGTSTPAHRLSIGGGPIWTWFNWSGAVALENGAAIAWQHNTSNQSFGIGQSNGGLYFVRTNSAPGTTASGVSYDMLVADNGNIGVGTLSPTSGKLQAAGGSTYSGVYATTSGNQLTNQSGVYGGSSAVNGSGVTGEANSGANAYGVWGKSTDGFGVYGEGKYGVVGKGIGNGSIAILSQGDVYSTGRVTAFEFQELSDRNEKTNFADVEPAAILRQLASIPIQTWNFRSQATTERHLGPMAQDFRAAFDLGSDDKHISTVDADGVALAAIQGLYEIVQEKDRQLAQLQQRVEQLERQLVRQ